MRSCGCSVLHTARDLLLRNHAVGPGESAGVLDVDLCRSPETFLGWAECGGRDHSWGHGQESALAARPASVSRRGAPSSCSDGSPLPRPGRDPRRDRRSGRRGTPSSVPFSSPPVPAPATRLTPCGRTSRGGAGLVVAFSALWLTLFSPRPEARGAPPLRVPARLGSAMAAGVVLGVKRSAAVTSPATWCGWPAPTRWPSTPAPRC